MLNAALAFSFSQLLLGMLLLLRRGRWNLNERLFFLLLCAIGGYLAVPLTGDC